MKLNEESMKRMNLLAGTLNESMRDWHMEDQEAERDQEQYIGHPLDSYEDGGIESEVQPDHYVEPDVQSSEPKWCDACGIEYYGDECQECRDISQVSDSMWGADDDNWATARAGRLNREGRTIKITESSLKRMIREMLKESKK